MIQSVRLNVNGRDYDLAVDTSMSLGAVLRDKIGLTGVKIGCNDGDCGACTVLVDGKAVASCTALAVQMQGKKIITIEGLAQHGELHPVQQAFIDCAAIQCGFCTPGMVLTTVALLNENPDPTEEEIRDYLRGNICRCTGYVKIIEAVFQAKAALKAQKEA